ncbi:MAG TPA: 2'-5' RNA ligase, partial [Cytophagales bacterium]|nr:2'-5' RNA ligase [Cytophagales bacterium]
EQPVLALVKEPSRFGSEDVHTGQPCSCEGIVSRNAASFPVAEMAHQVFKYVRAGHVKTDEHWTRKWRRAPLIHEKPKKDVDANG